MLILAKVENQSNAVIEKTVEFVRKSSFRSKTHDPTRLD